MPYRPGDFAHTTRPFRTRALLAETLNKAAANDALILETASGSDRFLSFRVVRQPKPGLGRKELFRVVTGEGFPIEVYDGPPRRNTRLPLRKALNRAETAR